jgi:RHS repeat-associated protein
LPDGLYEVFTPDAAGQITRHADFAGATTSYTYDPMGRVLSRTYPDSTVVSFTYTPTGQRATATDARGTTRYAYDSRNRLVQLTYPDGRMLAYGYDAHGDRTTLTAKIGTQSYTTTTSYDAAGRPNQVKDPTGRAFAITYDAYGNRTQVQYPNTTKTAYTYDALNRLTNLTATQTPASGAATTVTSLAYTLDEAGRRTQVAEADGTVRAFGYDSIDRLTSEAVTGTLSYVKAFAYDPVGNRLTQTTTGAGAGAVTYTYDGRDRLTNENATTYSYDANGNVTSKSGEATYTWDFQNRLTSAAMSDTTLVSHVYDADGNRVQTTVTPPGTSATPVVTNFLVDTSGGLSQVVADTDRNGSLTALYIRNRDELLAVMRPAPGGTWTTRFVHSDAIGSVRLLTDETGTASDSRAYEAFGTKNIEAGTDNLAYNFAGEPFEGTSHLAYHRARWMDSRVGRFEGMDQWPVNLRRPWTLNRYPYSTSSPLNRSDPSGRFETTLGGISAAGFGQAILSTIATVAFLKIGYDIITENRLFAESHDDNTKDDSSDKAGEGDQSSAAQDKILTKGEIKKLKDAGIDPHDLKPEPKSRYDLYKDPKGNIKVKPKGGAGPGDDTGFNINDF